VYVFTFDCVFAMPQRLSRTPSFEAVQVCNLKSAGSSLVASQQVLILISLIHYLQKLKQLLVYEDMSGMNQKLGIRVMLVSNMDF
jgi:hypothetical protein